MRPITATICALATLGGLTTIGIAIAMVSGGPPSWLVLVGSLAITVVLALVAFTYFTAYIPLEIKMTDLRASLVEANQQNIGYRNLLFSLLSVLSTVRHDNQELGEVVDTYCRQLEGVSPDADTLRLLMRIKTALRTKQLPALGPEIQLVDNGCKEPVQAS